MTTADLIAAAFAEDLPNGDLTTDNLGVRDFMGRARLVAKEDLVLAGRDLFESCMKFIGEDIQVHWKFKDGDLVLAGQNAAWLEGSMLKMLKAERTSLNFLGRLSGIATYTRCYVEKVKGTKCRILDTRKTTPGWRELEKRAVRMGGGQNHRMNLSTAVLIKENHIAAAGGIKKALYGIRQAYKGHIEIECRSLEDVKTAVNERVQRILLDNMSLEDMRQAREMIPSFIEVEASGNMTLERVKDVAELGIEFISIGALTHSAPCADLSLLFEWEPK